MLKIIGVLIIAWGVLDFGLSWIDTDLYGEIGINLSEFIYPYTAYIAGIIGWGVYALGNKMSEGESEEDTMSEDESEEDTMSEDASEEDTTSEDESEEDTTSKDASEEDTTSKDPSEEDT